MKHTEIYFERLVTTGSYSNVRFGLRTLIEDGDDFESVKARLADDVDLEIARLVADKTALNVESRLRFAIEGLQAQERELRERLSKLIDWRARNAELVKLYEMTVGKEFDPVPF